MTRFQLKREDGRWVIRAYKTVGAIRVHTFEYAQHLIGWLAYPEQSEVQARRTMPLVDRMKRYGADEAPALELPDSHCPDCQRAAGRDESDNWEESTYPGGATYTFTCPHCGHTESESV